MGDTMITDKGAKWDLSVLEDGRYAFTTMLNKDNEAVYPFYSNDALTIYDGHGNPYDFVALTFTGNIDGNLLCLSVSEDGMEKIGRKPDEFKDDAYTVNFNENERVVFKNIFTNAENKNISFTLLIESENVGNLSVDGHFELSPPAIELATTPEPATLLMFGTGIAGAGLAAWRKRK
jgi:hypothetical protein